MLPGRVAGRAGSEVKATFADLPETTERSALGAAGAAAGIEVAKSSPVSLRNNFLNEANMILTFNYFGQRRFLLLMSLSFALLGSHFLSQILFA